MDNTDLQFLALEAARHSRNNYWQALLTLNGILISVFSAAAILSLANKWLLFALVANPILSAFLLIMCFRDSKNLDIQVGRDVMTGTIHSPEEMRTISENTVRSGFSAFNREQAVEGLLLLESIIILIKIVA